MSAMKNTNNMAMEAFSKAGDLHKRIIFTLVALFLYRFGTFVPLPGINPDVLSDIFANSKNGLLNMFDTFAGGALSRMALLTLNIMPYISASIITGLLQMDIIPYFTELKESGAAGRQKINQINRYLGIVLAFVQGFAMAFAFVVCQCFSSLAFCTFTGRLARQCFTCGAYFSPMVYSHLVSSFLLISLQKATLFDILILYLTSNSLF